MLGILLRSRVGSQQIEPRKSPEMIAGSDKGSDRDLFADLVRQGQGPNREKNWAPGVQVIMCQRFSICPCSVFE